MATTTQRYGQTTTDPAQMAINRANLVNNSNGTLQEVNGNVVPKVQDVPAPVSTPTITPTIKRDPGLLQQAQEEQASAANSMTSARREAESYAAQQRQARIDAINTTFAPRIAREQQEGDARMSRVAAINFKQGIVGSGADTTKTGEQKMQNEGALRAIEEAKAVAINEAFGWADQLARQRAEDIYSDRTKGADANVALYKQRADTAIKALANFASSDITAEQLKGVDINTYNTLKDVTGMADSEIDAYLKTHAPEGTYQWSAAQIHGSKMVIPTVKNGKTSLETIDLGFTPDKKIETTAKTDAGLFIIYNDGTSKLVPGTADNPTASKESGFTLNEGQTRYDANGNVIAASPTSSTMGKLTPAQESAGVSYIYNNGGTDTDIEKFKTDRAYQAWVLNKLE